MKHTKNFENKKPIVSSNENNLSNPTIQTNSKADHIKNIVMKENFKKAAEIFSFSKSKKKIDTSKTTEDFDAMIRIVFLNSMGFFFFRFVIPFVTYSLLNATGLEIGFVFAGQTIGGLISYPIVGYLTDRVSKKKLVLFGSTGRGISYVIMYIGIYMGSLSFFAFGIFIQGFMVGFFWTPFDVLVSQKSNKHNRSYAFGKRGGGIGKGNLIGSIFSVIIFILASTFDPGNNLLIYSPLLIFCVSNFVAGFLFNRQVDEHLLFNKNNDNRTEINVTNNISADDRHLNSQNNLHQSEIITRSNKDGSNKDSFSKIMSLSLIAGYISLAIGFFLSNVNRSVRNPFIQSYLLNTITNSGIIVMIIYFPSVIIAQLASPKLGELADRIKPSIGITITSIFGSLSTFLLISTNSGILFAIFLISSSTFSRTGTLILRNILSRLSIKNRGKIFGWFMWFKLLGGVLGPIAGGLAWDSLGSSFPFILSIFLELFLIPIYLIAIKYLKNHMAEKLE